MNFDMTIKKYFYFALLMLASLWVMPSCSEDDMPGGEYPGNEEPPVEEHVPNPAGDDFYMFVNGEWFESLTNTNESQGFAVDATKIYNEKFIDVARTINEISIVTNSLFKMYEGGQQANLDRVDEIVEELLAEVETAQDAYRMIGQLIRMGLADEYAQIYMVFEEGEIYYTIAPSSIEEEGEEEAKARRRSLKKIDWSKFKKYAPKSRSTDVVIESIVEGTGLGLDYLSYCEDLDEFIANLQNCTLDELKEFIQDAVHQELLPFCGDEYVQQITGGVLQTTTDYFNLSITTLFDYSLSYHYYKAYVTEETKANFKEYGKMFSTMMSQRIEKQTWMSSQTKQAALDKLANMRFFYGWPENEYTEVAFANPKGELLVDDIIEAKLSRTRLIEAKLGNNLRDESMMLIMYSPGPTSLTAYNAFYLPVTNAVHIFSSFMMEPEYSSDMDPSELYVSLSTLTHEITHSLDKTGADYDAEGNESNWWAAEDKAKFDAMNADFAAQLSALEAAPGIHQDGNLTVGENLADLIGLQMSFDALTDHLNKKGVKGEALIEAQKNFFEIYAYRYRSVYTPDEFQMRLNDEHGIDKIRVNGIVQHMDSWYELYQVVEGDALYLPKEERVNIW
jgi:predicted metalloendopeptidase